MGVFAFKALDLAGVSTKGEIEAEDKQGVAQQLRTKGLIVLDIDEQVPKSAGDIFDRFKKVKPDDLVIGTRQLATMVSSGMSLLRSLYVIEEQTDNDKLAETWADVRKDVEAGIALSGALSKHPDVFNSLYTAMVAAGETGGILDSTLKRVADQLEKDAQARAMVDVAGDDALASTASGLLGGRRQPLLAQPDDGLVRSRHRIPRARACNP